jgi:hypothetical protein
MTGDCHVRFCEGLGVKSLGLLDYVSETLGGFSEKKTHMLVSGKDSHEKALVKGRRGDLGFPLHLTLIRTL